MIIPIARPLFSNSIFVAPSPQGKTVTAVGWTSLLKHPARFCRQLAQGYAYAGTPRDRQKEHGTL